MGDTGDSKNNLIKQIFETMEYGNDLESLSLLTEWLKNKQSRIFAYKNSKDETPSGEKLSLKNATNNEYLCDIYNPDAALVEDILSTAAESKNAWIELSPIKRTEILSKLAAEIQTKQDLFVQVEIAARGILSKDTKTKALPLLTDCLQYYSSFCGKNNVENPTFKPKGLVVAILSDSNSLSALGYILGPCLASGYQIILQTGPQLSLSASILIEISIQVGIPEGTIRLICGNVDSNAFLINPDVSVVAIFDDLYKEKYMIANNFCKKIIHFNSSGCSMIVFDSCDLDSACHSVVNAAFAYKGMLPWSLRNIFVQENIFELFIYKLKHLLKQIKIGKSDQKNVDFSYPDEDILTKLESIVTEAKSLGVDVYQPNPNEYFPTVFIGGNLFPNNVIKEDLNIPIVTVVAFRSSNEGVSLANNSRHGLSVSIWTENTSLINEIMGKLKFGNIWINSHGLFAPNVSTSLYKTSGNAFFGGREGFYEYLHQSDILIDETISQAQNSEAMEKAITEAKKAQDTWCKMSQLDRIKSLQQAAQSIQNIKTSWKVSENWIVEWSNLIYEHLSNDSNENFIKHKSFNVLSAREPCGVIAVETLKNEEEHNKRLIIAALSEANSVIILNSCEKTHDFYNHVAKVLPKSVLTVIAHSQEAIKVAALHKELNVFIGQQKSKVFFSLPLKSSSKFKTAKGEWRDAVNKVTLVKNVWFNKGQSFV